MMTGKGPFGNLEMGGMFTVVKVRDDLAAGDYRDPGWYRHPPARCARKVSDDPDFGQPVRRAERDRQAVARTLQRTFDRVGTVRGSARLTFIGDSRGPTSGCRAIGLDAGLHLVHRVADAEPPPRIREADAAAGAGMPKLAGFGPYWPSVLSITPRPRRSGRPSTRSSWPPTSSTVIAAIVSARQHPYALEFAAARHCTVYARDAPGAGLARSPPRSRRCATRRCRRPARAGSMGSAARSRTAPASSCPSAPTGPAACGRGSGRSDRPRDRARSPADPGSTSAPSGRAIRSARIAPRVLPLRRRASSPGSIPTTPRDSRPPCPAPSVAPRPRCARTMTSQSYRSSYRHAVAQPAHAALVRQQLPDRQAIPAGAQFRPVVRDAGAS